MGKLEGVGAAALRRDKAPKQVAPVIQTERPRMSVSVDRDDYNWLIDFCQDIAMELGRTRVNHVWVMRAVLKELLKDPALQRRVIDRVREDNAQ
jgi:hypothetical protein